jgi:hypothetical protein
MDGKDTLITKKRRGPAPTGQGTLVGVRLHPDMLEKLDAWLEGEARHKGQDKPNSRAHAIREILRERFDD